MAPAKFDTSQLSAREARATEYLRAASRGLATHVSPTLGAWLSQGETLRRNCRQATSMTRTEDSPEEAKSPYWSDELLAVLAEALGDEDRARQTLEGIIQQAQEGKAMRTLSTERLASHLTVWCSPVPASSTDTQAAGWLAGLFPASRRRDPSQRISSVLSKFTKC